MNQEKFGNFLKELRKKNNLTQKQFADKYNVTYQAVSKWENGINLPDKYLIKQISKDFKISLDELFDGEYKKKKNYKFLVFITIIFFISFTSLILINILKPDDFEFRTLSSNCENFNISGNIAYNKTKSAIYITNIQYCGGEDKELYQEIECILYETDNEIEKIIGSTKYQEKSNITLEEFLKKVTLTVDNYEKICKDYSKNSLYLIINATLENGKITSYKIPLNLDDNCF